MRSARRFLRSLFAAMMLMSMVLGAFVGNAAASTTGSGVVGVPVEGTNQGGNVTCQEINPEFFTAGGAGNTSFSLGASFVADEFGQVEFGSEDGVNLNWSSSLGIDYVIVKGGPAALGYAYDEAFGDSGLQAPINPNNGQPYGLSNVTFCWDKDPEPEITYVYGCSQGYYKNWGPAETMNLTLGNLGIAGKYDSNATLLQVLNNPGSGKVGSGTYDGYIRQQVTAWINSQLIPEFALDPAEILAGGYTQADLEWHNHGASGENIVAVCPFQGNP